MLPWLHTDGKTVKNELGQIVELRGAALGGMYENYPGAPWFQGWPGSGQAFVSLPAALGKKANSLRLPFTPFTYWSHYITDNPSAINLLNSVCDEIVNFCVANNIYVTIDFHGVPDSDYPIVGADPTKWINWVVHWADRYNNVPNVIYELWNEPWIQGLGNGNEALGRQRWISMVEQCCVAIVSVNPKALMIVNVDDRTVMDTWIANPLPYNVVYCFGFYYFHLGSYYIQPLMDGDIALGRARLRDWMLNYRKINANIPLLMKEGGWKTGDETTPPTMSIQMNEAYTIWTEFGLSWYQWIWWSSPGNYGMYSGSSLYNPIGTVWAQYLDPTPGPTITHQLTVNSNISNIPFTIRRVS